MPQISTGDAPTDTVNILPRILCTREKKYWRKNYFAEGKILKSEEKKHFAWYEAATRPSIKQNTFFPKISKFWPEAKYFFCQYFFKRAHNIWGQILMYPPTDEYQILFFSPTLGLYFAAEFFQLNYSWCICIFFGFIRFFSSSVTCVRRPSDKVSALNFTFLLKFKKIAVWEEREIPYFARILQKNM